MPDRQETGNSVKVCKQLGILKLVEKPTCCEKEQQYRKGANITSAKNS